MVACETGPLRPARGAPGCIRRCSPRFPPGVRFRKFGPVGSAWSDLSSAVREGGRLLYLALDDKGTHLKTRLACAAPTLARFPRFAAFVVVGGACGFSPYTSGAVVAFLRQDGASGVFKVAFGARQRRASRTVSRLMAMDGDADLRDACALTFYTKPGDAEMNSAATEIAVERAELQGVRSVASPPTQSPLTWGEETPHLRPVGIRLWRFPWELKWPLLGRRGGISRAPKRIKRSPM